MPTFQVVVTDGPDVTFNAASATVEAGALLLGNPGSPVPAVVFAAGMWRYVYDQDAIVEPPADDPSPDPPADPPVDPPADPPVDPPADLPMELSS